METTKKITKKQMFEAIIALLNNDFCEVSTEAMITFCKNEITLLQNKADKAKARAEEQKREGDALMDEVYKVLVNDEFMSIDQVTEALNKEDATRSKVTYRLNLLANEHRAERGEVTLKNEGTNKSRKVVGYRKIG